MDIQETGLGDVQWIYLSQHCDRWRDLASSNTTSGRAFLEKNFVAYHAVS